jgi:hypothetical protein
MKFVFEIPVRSALRVCLTAVLFMTTCVAVADASLYDRIVAVFWPGEVPEGHIDTTTCVTALESIHKIQRRDWHDAVELLVLNNYNATVILDAVNEIQTLKDMKRSIQKIEVMMARPAAPDRLRREIMDAISVNGVVSEEKVVTLIRPIAEAILLPILRPMFNDLSVKMTGTSKAGWRPCWTNYVFLVVYPLFCLFKSSWKSTSSTWSDYGDWMRNLAFAGCSAELATMATRLLTWLFGVDELYGDCFVAFGAFAFVWSRDGDCNAFWTHPIVNGRAILSAFCRAKPIVVDPQEKTTATSKATVAAVPVDTSKLKQHKVTTEAHVLMGFPRVKTDLELRTEKKIAARKAAEAAAEAAEAAARA